MNIFELSQLKNILFELEEEYANELTKYSILNADTAFARMSDVERKMLSEKKIVSKLRAQINDKIKEIIFTNYAKENKE